MNTPSGMISAPKASLYTPNFASSLSWRLGMKWLGNTQCLNRSSEGHMVTIYSLGISESVAW